jgi:hypothetical protein
MRIVSDQLAYRCDACGNRTRFDVYESVTRRRFAHYTLGGDVAFEDEEILSSTVERVVCRWCERDDAISVIAAGEPSDGPALSEGLVQE